MARATRAKKPVDYNEDDTKGVGDTNGVSKPAKTEKAASKKSAPKRKAEPEDDEKEDAKSAKAAPKKRKTTKQKEEDSMPLADRTPISSLGKAMYIGAHVSAAGGTDPPCSVRVQVLMLEQAFKTP